MTTKSSLPENNVATLSPISASTRDIIEIALGKIEKPQKNASGKIEKRRKFALWTHPVSFYLFLSAIVCLFIALIIVVGTFLFPLEMSRPAARPYIVLFTDLMLAFAFLYHLSVIVVVGISETFHPVRGHIRILQTRIADEDEIIARLLEFEIAALHRASRRLTLARETLLHRASSIVGELGKTGVVATAAALIALFVHYRTSLQTDIAYVDGFALIILGFLLGAVIGNHIAAKTRVAQYLIEEAIIEKQSLAPVADTGE